MSDVASSSVSFRVQVVLSNLEHIPEVSDNIYHMDSLDGRIPVLGYLGVPEVE